MEPLFEGHLKLTCLSSIAPQVRGKFYMSPWVFATSQPTNTTNIERVLCVYRMYRALVHRSPRTTGVLLTSFQTWPWIGLTDGLGWVGSSFFQIWFIAKRPLVATTITSVAENCRSHGTYSLGSAWFTAEHRWLTILFGLTWNLLQCYRFFPFFMLWHDSCDDV